MVKAFSAIETNLPYDDKGRRKCMKFYRVTIAHVLVMSTAFALCASAFAQDRGETWTRIQHTGKAHGPVDFLWEFKTTRYKVPYTKEQLDKAREDYFEQEKKQNVPREEAEKQVDRYLSLLADAGPDVTEGTKEAVSDGKTARLELSVETLQRGTKPLTAINQTTVEYSNGAYHATYFGATKPTSGEIDRVRGGKNSFAYSDATDLDPYLFCLYPLSNGFTQADIERVTGNSIVLRRTSKDTPTRSHDYVVTFNADTGLPESAEILISGTKMVLVRYIVKATKEVEGVIVPAAVTLEEYDGRGGVFLRAECALKNASFGSAVDTANLSTLGPSGVSVIDNRFGPGNEKSYKTKDHFLSDDEVAEIGRPLRSPAPPKEGGGPLPVIAGSAAVLLFGAGVWQARANRLRKAS